MASKRKVKRIEHEEVVERFARRLKELRLERGLTQADLADRAAVAVTYVSKLESVGAAPGIDLVSKLAAALGVETAELVPSSIPKEPLEVFRDQARHLFGDLLREGDQQTLALLNPFMALLLDAINRKPKGTKPAS